jgi:peptidoglycan hydrolase-like protein with peptidoglycan-binding domain
MKRMTAVAAGVAVAAMLSGCATGRKQQNAEMENLRGQVSSLEAQLQSRDAEIASLRQTMEQISAQMQQAQALAASDVDEAKSRPSVKQVQTALENAGYDVGTVDGRMGRKTREAIRAFQRANGLPVDGKAGKKTWELLKEYLTKKTK